MWTLMNSQSHRAARQLSSRDIPIMPGVYAWYRQSEPVYASRATGKHGLRDRIWGNHLTKGKDLSPPSDGTSASTSACADEQNDSTTDADDRCGG